ncbi:uncharacterized protein LOC111357651 [Spodoptera litura]|uniref:Uncharacterized protein LOC111357651 n=1 Tax=Spodoptera litura TaxID=69820 RepID=A0A9J7EHQ5_SPOLT|nr:uncharacterized protein LOC111357651 [Spodoptera litura]
MKYMWLLCLFVALPTVYGQFGFGKSYLGNSRVCHQWNCINTKLGLEDSIPPKDQSVAVLRQLLPQGPWQDVVENVVEHCYVNRSRRFTNTCPGQALMHCLVDQMIDFCPVTSLRKDDSCSIVTSINGMRYMFSQSRYADLEKNLPREHRPTWFLKNYFDKNCCDLPVIFNTTVLEECGFSSMINYIDHGLKHPIPSEASTVSPTTTPVPTTTTDSGDGLKIVDLNTIQEKSTNVIIDPMECCDMEDFIKSSWKSECDFHLQWGGKERLTISQPPATEPPTTTTERTEAIQDIMLVPQSCEKETCVFRNLGIIKGTEIDKTAYIDMLANFTGSHQAWIRATEKVVSRCLNSVNLERRSDCLINDVLACTLDVLTEYCPYKRKSGICKHGKHDVPCQISSSKSRPKNRREICLLPELVHHDHLYECGLDALYKVERVAVPVRHKKHVFPSLWHNCKQLETQTSCIMDKMGILNRYKFMDYFKMKDKIRQFTEDKPEWSAMMDIYTSAYINLPMYSDHCNSERKLLNVIDTMLMTCPVSKRKNTPQCNSLFMEMVKATPADNQTVTKEKADQIMKHYHHVFMPTRPRPSRFDVAIRKKHTKHVTPAFQFGILNSKNAPPVRVAYVKPPSYKVRPPLILQPVYLRPTHFIRGRVSDGAFRSNLFWHHNQLMKPQESIEKSSSTTSSPEVSTSATLELSTMPPQFNGPFFELPTKYINNNDMDMDLGRPE